MELGFAISIGFVVAVAVVADRRGRSPFAWGAFAFLASVLSSALLIATSRMMSAQNLTLLRRRSGSRAGSGDCDRPTEV